MESGERFAYRRSNMGRIRIEIWDFMESRCKSNSAMTMEMLVMNGIRFLENVTREYICRTYLKIYITCKCRNFIILNHSSLVFILRKRRIQLHNFIFDKKKKAK